MRRNLGDGIELDDDAARIDVDAVHDFLSNHAYWAQGRPREAVERTVREASRVVGLYAGGRQIGFARAFTDGVAAVYLADVYVLPEHRGRGLGVELVREMVEGSPWDRPEVAPAHARRARPVPPVRLRRAVRARDGATVGLAAGWAA